MFHRNSNKKAFTLVELMVVIGIIGLLLGLVMPALSRARELSKITVVHCDLYNIGKALEMYAMQYREKYPPTREDCAEGEHYHQLPEELVSEEYLPGPKDESGMAAGMEDLFNPGHTYKYRGVGELIRNQGVVLKNEAWLWVPEGFPDYEKEEGKEYTDPQHSPVTWVLYSQGPKFDWKQMGLQHYPVPRKTWYDSKLKQGVITRMRLKKGRHIGSFER